ncbi:type VII secretion protein EccE [Streptacidiphilus rugosus]|uniref:type VII secretion protein EccE n=1 Tax=Streptacidiphilus rugosus TaxID=405783 RepID=UPI00055CAE48|nr:type VII secretion protein EccE [Streptacidiphilus rugosus]
MPSQTASRHAPSGSGAGRPRTSNAVPDGPTAQSARGDVTVRLRPRPGRLGPVRLVTLVLVEAVAAAALIGWVHGRIALIAGGLVGVLLLLAALLRFGGLSLADMLRARAALRRRIRRAALAPHGPDVDPVLTPVLECEPALRVVTHTIDADGGAGRRERREIGMVGDGTFLSALIQVEAPDRPLRPQAGAVPLPLALLAQGLRADDVVLDAVQLVQYAQPAPAPHLPEQALAARAYRELPSGPSTPGLRLTWVAVRLDPELCRSAVAARGGGEGGARRALQRGVDQLASRLVEAGLRATVLDTAQVTAAIGTAVCPNPVAVTHGRGSSGAGATEGSAPRRTVETAKSWRCDDRWHRSYWIGQWPRLNPAATTELVSVLTGTPALGSCFALTLRESGGGAVALSGHVRITARGESELTTAARQLETRARSAGAGLVRLELEQVPGVLATLPLGGTR